jgi:hypothetical protein
MGALLCTHTEESKSEKYLKTVLQFCPNWGRNEKSG